MEPFLRATRALRSLWREGDRRAHTRLFETLVRDEYIVVGSSQGGGTYREHVVPLAVIRDHSFTMFGAGASDEEVAGFIQAHLKIVMITPEEAHQLDRVLRLRTTMPAGWAVGDDVMARFAVAGISVIAISKPRKNRATGSVNRLPQVKA